LNSGYLSQGKQKNGGDAVEYWAWNPSKEELFITPMLASTLMLPRMPSTV
jgi:hypothetical protein